VDLSPADAAPLGAPKRTCAFGLYFAVYAIMRCDVRMIATLAIVAAGCNETSGGQRIAPATSAVQETCGWLRSGEVLRPGESRTSCDGAVLFVHQTDGNVVLYFEGQALWSSNTWGQATDSLVMQGDGNLVLYAPGGVPLWSSDTWYFPGAQLAIQSDCNGVIYGPDSVARWATNTYPCPPIQMPIDEVLDYYVQNVCLDASGNPTAQDPYGCGNQRNLNLDEPVLFMLHDAPDGAYPNGHQGTVSVPIRLGSGNPGDPIGVLHTFDFGGDTSSFLEYTPSSGNISAIHPWDGWPIDGWDVLEHNGGYASYIGTCDGGGGIQSWIHWANGAGTCVYDDAWLLLDQNRIDATGSRAYDAIASLNSAHDFACPSFMNPAYTWWQVYDVTYTSGKSMRSIVSTHMGGPSPSESSAFERFYYTKVYGRTRWESWSRTQTSWAGNCNGPTYDPGYGMYRNDCRDWSHGTPVTDGGWLPAFQWPVHYAMAKGNWLMNGDFGSGTNFNDAGGEFNWSRNNGPNWQYLQEWPGADSLRQGNHYLNASLTGGWGSVYQDVPASGAAPGWWFSYGVRVWSDQPGTVTLVVWELPGGVQHPITIQTGPDRHLIQGWFDVQTNPTTLRFEVYLGTGDTIYHLDDAFLTQT
jgi:hypothetical protein